MPEQNEAKLLSNSSDKDDHKLIAYTTGDPAGIGIDLLFGLDTNEAYTLIVFADPKHILSRAKECHIKVSIIEVNESHLASNSLPKISHGSNASQTLFVFPILDTLVNSVSAGKANKQSSPYILSMLNTATKFCQKEWLHAMVTGPINKALINEYGIPFSGHTEYLADITTTKQTVMMLTNSVVSVCLATTHIPLSSVASEVTAKYLETILTIMQNSLRHQFNIKNPNIAVLGLNPHAGEDGHIGSEEITIIKPLLEKLNKQGYQLMGPISADTAFCQPTLESVDAYLAMYHDQGLPIVKYTGFGDTVNVTLGLPIVRTSVDHGTAYHLAASNQADAGSLIKAIKMASQLNPHLTNNRH